LEEVEVIRASDRIQVRVVAFALLLIVAASARAQTANASTAATALSGAFTARATGYNAVNWNPANLAMPGNPGFSLTLVALDGNTGLKPIDLQKIHDGGPILSRSVREQWLLDVTAQGGQTGGASGGLTELGLSIGSLAFQVSTKVSTDMNLSPDAIEGMLFGNKGRDTTTLHTLQLAGSRFQVAGYSTGAVSYGFPLAKLIPLANFAVGATVKYTVGHFLVMGLDNGSSFGTNDIGNFAAILPDSLNRPRCDSLPGQTKCQNKLPSGNVGSGVGLDLGGAWTIPGFRFGVSFQNLVNTFKWDTTKFAERSATALFSQTTSSTNVDSIDAPYATAPAALRAKVAAMKFKPVVAAGVAFDWIPMTTVSADIRQQVGDGIEVGPKSLIAAGIEYRMLSFLPLRAGVSSMTGGFGVSGGLGIHLLGFEMGVAGYLRKRNGGTESGGTLSLFSINP
jgi:Family of unknown function (DUF5723)